MHCTILHAPAFGDGAITERLVIEVDAALASVSPTGLRFLTSGAVLEAMRTRVPYAARFHVAWRRELFEDCFFDADDGAIQAQHHPLGDAQPHATDAEAKEATEERRFGNLVADVEDRLERFADPRATKKRFIGALVRSEKEGATTRTHSRAKRFAKQGGTCATCGEKFNETRKLSLRSDDGRSPLVCIPCDRRALLRNVTRRSAGPLDV